MIGTRGINDFMYVVWINNFWFPRPGTFGQDHSFLRNFFFEKWLLNATKTCPGTANISAKPDTLLDLTFSFINTLRQRQHGCHFADDTFKSIFLNENVRILIKILLKFVAKGSINNIPALVQVMAWRRPGNKPLPEPVMVRLLTNICVTRPQWVKEVNLSLSKWLNCQSQWQFS